MELKVVDIEKPEDVNIIIGQSHFIKTVEDLYEALADSAPGIKFGLAFCESSGPRLIRHEGNDSELEELAIKACEAIACGHIFVIMLRNAWPINVMLRLKSVPEVTRVFCATANPVQAIVAETEKGRALLGVVDGGTPLGVEDEEKRRERMEFLRKIGYKAKF